MNAGNPPDYEQVLSQLISMVSTTSVGDSNSESAITSPQPQRHWLTKFNDLAIFRDVSHVYGDEIVIPIDRPSTPELDDLMIETSFNIWKHVDETYSCIEKAPRPDATIFTRSHVEGRRVPPSQKIVHLKAKRCHTRYRLSRGCDGLPVAKRRCIGL